MLFGSVVGSIIGSLCSGLLPEDLYNKVTGAILLLLAVQMLVSYIKKKQKKDDTQSAGQIHKGSNTVKAVCFGLLGGMMSGLVGLSGGGPIMAGLMILGCQALETVGPSVLVLFGIAVTGFITHFGIGSIGWELVGLLTIGTICCAFVGPILLKRADKKKLEKILQPVLFLMIVEHEEPISNLIRLSLKKAGHISECVFDGEEAAVKLEENTYEFGAPYQIPQH
ncbi:MAG: TSUP family transporter [Lawsonibacter sp.]|nr:TSUP family transporter [Lawsonibacter sp.]